MTYIEVKRWNDDGGTYTDCVMACEDNRDVKSITRNFCSINDLPGTSGLPDNMIADTTDEFIKYLKKEGFKIIKTHEVVFGD